MGSSDGIIGISTVINNITVTNATTVGELKNILKNFSDQCPITNITCKYIFPKDREGQLQIISQ